MQVGCLCLILTASLLVTARGDLSLVQKVEGAGSVSQITIKTKSGDVLSLMNTEKKFLRISADKSKAIADMASKYAGDPASAAEKSKLTPSGKKEMINGYEAEEYIRESPSLKESYWIALKFPDSAAIVKQLQAVIPTAWND